MLPKKKRLNKSSFNIVIDEGKPFHSTIATLRLKETTENSQFSISIPKKVSKSAVVRNKMKRKVFSIIKELYPDLQKKVMGIIIMKPNSDKLDFETLEKEIINLFVKTGLLK
jgi:ribonuclease P protein component